MSIAVSFKDEYEKMLLSRVNKNHSFLKFLIFNGIKFPENVDLESLTGEGYVQLIDSQIAYPSQKHHEILQALWIDVHKYFMGVEFNREVSDNDAAIDFVERKGDFGLTQKERYEIFYASKYIQPALLNGTVEDSSKKWAVLRVQNADRILEKVLLNYSI